jgi:hypothetical protein
VLRSSEEEKIGEIKALEEVNGFFLILVNEVLVEVIDSNILDLLLLLMRSNGMGMDLVGTFIKSLFFMDD